MSSENDSEIFFDAAESLPIQAIKSGKMKENMKEKESQEEILSKEKLKANKMDIETVKASEVNKEDLNGISNCFENNQTLICQDEEPTSSKLNYIPNDIISEKMIEEERKLEKNSILEEQKMRKKLMAEEKKVAEEECYKRLHLLLSRSSIYAKFMSEKLEKHELIQKKKEDLKERQGGNVKKRKSANVTSATFKKQRPEANVMDVFKKENMGNLSFEESQNGTVKDKVSPLKNSTLLDSHPKLFYGGTMRPYQIEGFEWLKTLFENGVNGILADEMGLGKTIQSIAFIAYLVEMGVPGPFFICGPLSTVPNWYAEFQRFTPDLPLILYHGTIKEREELRTKILRKVDNGKVSCFPVVITSYQIALIDAPKFSRTPWKMLIIDEAHRIKNFQCKLIKALKKYNAVHRLLLTGTPLQNNLTELWSLLNFILPEIFDDLQVFQSWFDITKLTQSGGTKEIIAQEQEKQIVSTIHQILTPFLLRRTKTDVELDLPSKKEIIVHAPLTKLQQQYYTDVINQSIRKALKCDNETGPINTKRISKQTEFLGCENEHTNIDDEKKIPMKNKQTESSGCENDSTKDIDDKNGKPIENEQTVSELHIQLINIEMCLRKICCHPYLISYPINEKQEYRVDEDIVKTSGKLLVMDAMLTELKKRGHKVLIFSQFVSLLEIIGDYCTYRNHKYCVLTGQLNLAERQVQLEAFKDESVFLFLISTKAGGLGINLVSADTVIIFDSDYNPQSDLQAQDRCHRIGQSRPVVVYRLVVPNTVDQKIIDWATGKRKLEKIIMQKGRFMSKDFNMSRKVITKEELLGLLESSDSTGFVKTDDNCVLSPEELEKLLDRSDMM